MLTPEPEGARNFFGALPAMDLGGSGRMVVCHDPKGAQFDLWQSAKQHGREVDVTFYVIKYDMHAT